MTETDKDCLAANCIEVYYAVLAKTKMYAEYGDHRSVNRQQANERAIELEGSPVFDSLFANKLWLESILPAAKV